MSVRRVIRSLALHRWPPDTVKASNDHFKIAVPTNAVWTPWDSPPVPEVASRA